MILIRALGGLVLMAAGAVYGMSLCARVPATLEQGQYFNDNTGIYWATIIGAIIVGTVMPRAGMRYPSRPETIEFSPPKS